MKHPFRHYLSKFKYVIALVVFAVFIGFIGENCIMERIKNKEEIATLERKIAAKKSEFVADSLKLAELKSDPEAIRTAAREQYYMKQPNEDVYIIYDNTAEADEEESDD